MPVYVPSLLTAALLLFACGCCDRLDFAYHDYKAMVDYLEDVHQQHPKVTNMYTIGTSPEGRELYVFVVGKDPIKHKTLTPNVKIVANSSAVGREVLLHFIDYLVTEQTNNSAVRDLLQTTRIHLLPTLDPDRIDLQLQALQDRNRTEPTRDPCDERDPVDLSESFPSHFNPKSRVARREVNAMMEWLSRYEFLLSAQLVHGGEMVVYPYGSYPGLAKLQPFVSQDFDVHLYLAEDYFRTRRAQAPNRTSVCQDGVVNGVEWYPINGGMMDYNVQSAECVEFIVGLSCCMSPAQLQDRWHQNKDALIELIHNAHMGVMGLVLTEEGQEIQDAEVTIVGRETFPITTSPFGEYWRLLLPGTYTMSVKAEGYQTTTRRFTVQRDRVTREDLFLEKTKKNQFDSVSLPECRPPVFVVCPDHDGKESDLKPLVELIAELPPDPVATSGTKRMAEPIAWDVFGVGLLAVGQYFLGF